LQKKVINNNDIYIYKTHAMLQSNTAMRLPDTKCVQPILDDL